MPIINLPDGNKIDFPNKVNGIEIAEKISKSLAKQALIMSVDGELKDLTYIIEKNASVKIAIESVEKLLRNSIDKGKLDKIYLSSIEETKLALKKKSS